MGGLDVGRGGLGSVFRAGRPTAKAPPAQPIPFNHKVHAAAGLTCLGCHTIAAPGDLAGLPGAAFCMGCHDTIKKDSPAIQTLKAFASERKPIPWVRVYKLPGFVYFSHQVHHKQARVECAVCHGPVADRNIIGAGKIHRHGRLHEMP